MKFSCDKAVLSAAVSNVSRAVTTRTGEGRAWADLAAVLAVEAGCDLLLVCHKTENLHHHRDPRCGIRRGQHHSRRPAVR